MGREKLLTIVVVATAVTVVGVAAYLLYKRKC